MTGRRAIPYWAFASTLLLVACGSNGSKGSPGSGAKKSDTSSTSDGGAHDGGAETPAACDSSADPGALVSVPAGDFLMGCNEKVDAACDPDERPGHTVSLSAFEIQRTEVTQTEYSACMADGACQSPSCTWSCDNAGLPANCVTWAQANDYCAWAGLRLPTEAEWERAARGDQGDKYPWGNDAPDCALASMAGCGDQPSLAADLEAGASPVGALNMAGNMVELVADWYDASYYAHSPAQDPTGPASGTRRVGRGGGFKSDANYLRTSKRDWYDLTDTAASLGFRCAR